MGEGGCRKIRPGIKLKPAENKAGYKNLSPSENKAGHPFQVRRKIRPGIRLKSAGKKGRADVLLRGQKKTGLPKMRKGRPICGSDKSFLRPAVKSQAKERSSGEDDLAGHVEQKSSPETSAPAVCGPTREKPPQGSETAAKNRKTEPKSSPEPGKESLPRNGGQNKISLLAIVLPSFCRANRSPPAVPPLRTESRSPSKDWLT